MSLHSRFRLGLISIAAASLALAFVTPAAADPFDEFSDQLAKDTGIADFQLNPADFGDHEAAQVKQLFKEVHYVNWHGYTVKYSPEVAEIPGTPGTPGSPAKQKDWYTQPGGERTADLNRNQCWVNDRQERKTVGARGPNNVCLWNNGTLASMGVGGSPAIPGIPGIPGEPRQCTFYGESASGYSC